MQTSKQVHVYKTNIIFRKPRVAHNSSQAIGTN